MFFKQSEELRFIFSGRYVSWRIINSKLASEPRESHEAEETAKRKEIRCGGSIELFAISAISRSPLSRDSRFARACRSYFSHPWTSTSDARESPHLIRLALERDSLHDRSIDILPTLVPQRRATNKVTLRGGRCEIQLFHSFSVVFLRQLYRCPTSSPPSPHPHGRSLPIPSSDASDSSTERARARSVARARAPISGLVSSLPLLPFDNSTVSPSSRARRGSRECVCRFRRGEGGGGGGGVCNRRRSSPPR